MTYVRIAVLNAAHEDANTTRNFRRELDASLAEFDVTEGELPTHFEFDALVVTGSRSSVYWDEEWIDATKEWVSEALSRNLPALGICWGHQLLADVLGGTVEDMGSYEVGYSEIEHHGNSRLFEGISQSFTAFTSHADEVSALPPGATPLAENHYSNHGFRKDRVFGVQFHPEYDQKTARELVRRKELDDERRDAVLAEITDENYEAACEAKLVFENFVEYVRELTAEESQTPSATNDDGDSSEPVGHSD
ncbi:glutamine amidotransferase (homolog to GMP synthase subunit A) [Natrialba magadii ATCC 43099]|uniref:Glutamine amidotransferase n=1 Tax=Natrialba magadii (strain ATCC 43099 / DSM 3394 / CCM 3739 / CIP 104546 / IAM 13178 / JCM 8861 / NBRC 102185 / NCIMB 2190 / MS3) TaxID=547559 RepID=D3SUR9_NATMM|nr:type 1 glutamine amidotransferase [Natrialba magadii]ADD05327.1 glutamine amidotransferase (homolog to GMP synthase subunit A) [Natrialba magadii ATCC 43099]ELY29355.1 glutamine amidotransferase [Natrialba magadii ATCC 43099]